jgi:signal transduction histidine kinase
MTTARDLLSDRVVLVFAEQRLSDAAEEIAAKNANYCTVFERSTQAFVGIVRLKDVASRSGERIFVDLIARPRPLDVHEEVDSRLVARALQAKQCDEAVVLRDDGAYLGLVTRESLLEWALNEQERVQQELEKEIESRQQVILRRTDELRNALVEAERYATLVSHDLKLPLRSIYSTAAHLARDYGPLLDGPGRRQLGRLSEAAMQMDALVEGFLEEARLARAKNLRLAVSLNRVVDDALVQCDPLIDERGAEVRVQRPLHDVFGRYVVVLQIVSNLVSNAVKHVPADRVPEVHIWSEVCDREILLSVRNNGNGLSEPDRTRLLEPDAPLKGKRDRAGLGLLIVKRAVHRLGGRLVIEGATVTARLPQAPRANPAEVEQSG